MTWRLLRLVRAGHGADGATRPGSGQGNQTVATRERRWRSYREAFGTLATTGDSDWYRITLTAGSDLRIETALRLAEAWRHLRVSLLDGNGFCVPQQRRRVSVRATAPCRTASPPATYHIAVDAGVCGRQRHLHALDVMRRGQGSAAVRRSRRRAENNDSAQSVASPLRSGSRRRAATARSRHRSGTATGTSTGSRRPSFVQVRC